MSGQTGPHGVAIYSHLVPTPFPPGGMRRAHQVLESRLVENPDGPRFPLGGSGSGSPTSTTP